ncbi:MAG: PilN domain-containing protein [Burkholderiales bacterium]|nr:PilN domain-containing protein [Burkholderiales bacterium]
MILINLLPHREARRQQRKQAFFAGIGFAVLVGAGIVLAWYTFVNTQISTQEEHNQFLSSEIKRLDAQISDVATLKAEIEALKARQKAVEDLQADRNMPVYLLNELVKQTPEGVFLTSVKQDHQQVKITGVAQTNERISEFLRNTASNSPWLEKPQLIEIRAQTMQVAGSKDQRRMFAFSMSVTLKRPPAPGTAASGAAGAASGAAAAGATAPAASTATR